MHKPGKYLEKLEIQSTLSLSLTLGGLWLLVSPLCWCVNGSEAGPDPHIHSFLQKLSSPQRVLTLTLALLEDSQQLFLNF